MTKETIEKIKAFWAKYSHNKVPVSYSTQQGRVNTEI